jgi:hypothetical protein
LGLLFVAVLAVFNRIELARLSESSPVETQDARLQALTARVAELVQESETYRKRAEVVPLERYDAERKNVEQRLVAIEQVLNDRPDEDLSVLRDRLSRLEEEWTLYTAPPVAPTVAPPPAPPPVPPTPAPQAKIAEPSFRVIGVERRGEARFLTILPARAEALSQARLLRVGDQEDGWWLEAIEEEAGVFRQGGRKHRLSLAGGKK